jgi:hypothetical protein
MTHLGHIVKSEHLHGVPFGYTQAVRNEFGRDTEFGIAHLHGFTWLPWNQVEGATLNDVLTYFEERERAYEDRIKKLRNMVGKKVPKYNPEKVLGHDAEGYLSDAYRHENGSITYVFGEVNPDADSPRTYAGNVATLINTNTRTIDVDEDDAGLAEAYDRFTHAEMRRYLAMFRSDIVHFDEHWSAGDSYGWGYVTRESWVAAMGEDYDGDITPEKAFDQEVKVYDLWARGEIYGSAHVAKRGEEPDFVYGHLGYDDHRDIAAYHTDSPILEVLA